jgi:hypothetical protein
MCAFGHPKLCGWFAGTFELSCFLHRAGDVTDGFMTDVAAKNEIEGLERLRWVSFGGHDTRLVVVVVQVRSMGTIVEETDFTKVAAFEQNVPA